MPKRKLDEVEAEEKASQIRGEECESEAGGEGSEDSNSSANTSSSADVPSEKDGQRPPPGKKKVLFDGVTVYYFQRKQGFVCVPSQGGSTLGMDDDHITTEKYSVPGFAKHTRAIHRQILREQQMAGKLPRTKLLPNKSAASSSLAESSSLPSDSSDSEEDLQVDDYYFLQPVPTRQRRLMLRQAGIKKIDTSEKEECKDIRTSREMCGCDCRVYCDPETCSCSQAGIKCQVDRLSFPCGCSKDGCGNTSGRIEFNPIRVRTHFIHTLMRLEMDKKHELECEAIRKLHGQSPKHTKPMRDDIDGLHANCDDGNHCGTPPREEQVDPALFNSNEKGSCRDCQNSELSDLMMQDPQFAAANGVDVDMDSCMSNGDYLSDDAQMGLSGPGQGPGSGLGNKQQDPLPQVLLFNDSDDDYRGENTTTMYQFKTEDSSYSESSDCSSEGSGSGEDPQAGFPGFARGAYTQQQQEGECNQHAHAHPTPGHQGQSNYCIPSQGKYEPSRAQPEQKFMEVNSASSTYKLEPISEILNPIRYPGYVGGSGAQAWDGCSESFCLYPQCSQSQLHNHSGVFQEKYAQCQSGRQSQITDYVYSQNSVSQSSHPRAGMSCVVEGAAGMPQISDRYMTQGHDFQNMGSFPGNLQCSQSPHPQQRPGSLNDTNGHTCQNDKPHFQDLNCQNQEQEEEREEEEDKPRYQELSNSNGNKSDEATLDSQEKTCYEDLSNATGSAKAQTPRAQLAFSPAGKHSADTSVEDDTYHLPEQQKIVAVPTTALTEGLEEMRNQEAESTQSDSENNLSDTSDTPDHSLPNRLDSEQASSPNFGEIIKESIVETVSA